MLIDVHTHPILPGYLKAMAIESGRPEGIAGASHDPWSIEQHLDVMAANGIHSCVGSLPALERALSGADGHALARRLNEELAELTAHPSRRFGAFAVVPLDTMDAALEETAYALDVLKLDGVCVSPHYQHHYLGDPFFDPWLEELNRRGTVLFVHPGMPPAYDLEKSRIFPSLLEFVFESTRAVTNMVLSGAKERYPEIKYIATHGGGTVPYLMQRIAFAGSLPFVYKGGPRYSPDDITKLLGSFYFDLAAATSSAALFGLRELVSPAQLLMGFDYPLMPSTTISPAKAALEQTSLFSAEDKALIKSGNAMRLFSRFAYDRSTDGLPREGA